MIRRTLQFTQRGTERRVSGWGGVGWDGISKFSFNFSHSTSMLFSKMHGCQIWPEKSTTVIRSNQFPTNHMIRSSNLRFGKVIKNQYSFMIRFGHFFKIRFDSWFDFFYLEFEIRFVIRFGTFRNLRFDSWFDSAKFKTQEKIRFVIRFV